MYAVAITITRNRVNNSELGKDINASILQQCSQWASRVPEASKLRGIPATYSVTWRPAKVFLHPMEGHCL